MKILLAIDGTTQSEAAAETIAAIKLSEGDHIKIVSVIDLAVPIAVNVQPEFISATNAEFERVAQENAERILKLAEQKIKEIIGNENIEVSTEILFGSPESSIVETAETMNSDLIIVGSHGYNRWERLLLGSVSDSVVHHAPCSVLVVRSPKNS